MNEQLILGSNTVQDIAADGEGYARQDNSGALILSDLLGYESARRSSIFTANTAVTGVAPGTSIGTTAAFALQNPDAGTKWLVILEASMGYVSGTLGAGCIHWVGHVPGVDFSGTAITEYSSRMGSGTAEGVALTTATVPSGGTLLRLFGSTGASLASTAVAPWRLQDKVDGRIIVPPGYGISIQGTTAAGSTPLVVYSVTWAEILIPS